MIAEHATSGSHDLFLTKWVQRLNIYKELSKSGIVTLVLISVLGGYLIGQPTESAFRLTEMLWTLAGVLCLASGSSALNQLQERKIDAEMPRTARRPLPSGRISLSGASTFVICSIGAGLYLLSRQSLSLCGLGLGAVVFYNGFYTLWWKKRWAFAAVPGAIPGALPILMGYSAATGDILSPAGVYLFFILFFWQMPHFWVLALRYEGDYKKGGIPTLPVAYGPNVTCAQIVVWCLAYVALLLVAPIFLPVRTIYLLVTLPLCLKVLWELRRFAHKPEGKSWLRFFLWINFSLILFISAAVIDLWSVYLVPYLIR